MRQSLKDALEDILNDQKKRVMHPSLQKVLKDLIEKGICDDTVKKAAFDATKEAFGISDEELKRILDVTGAGGDDCSCPACEVRRNYKSSPSIIACADGIAFLDFGEGDECVISVEAMKTKVLKSDYTLKDLKNPKKVLEVLRGLNHG